MAAAALSALPIIPDPEFTTRPITTSGGGKFVSALAPFLQEVESNQAAAQAAQQPGGLPQTRTQGAPVSNYFNYGQSGSIEDALGMGGGESFDLGFAEPPAMFAPMQFRSGGIVPAYAQGGTRHGHNAHGALNIVHAAGKPRIDYRRGDAVTGMGDGQSDDIPAMLADGEFVIPADVVSALGNGSTKAGSDKLYEMMHAIRDRARSTGVKDLPPPAKSPLSYLSKKGRR